MRVAPVIARALCAGVVLGAPAPVRAQVTTNDSALDQLGPATTTRPQHHPGPSTRPAPRSTATSPARPTPPAAPSAAAKPAKPAIPATPPAILALPPAVAVPLAHPPPDPVVPLADDAPGTAAPLPNGVRVTFGPERADLNQASVDALTRFAQSVATEPATSINIFAYAEGKLDDPSTPRRLSLQRALAARAVLMKAGIASPRIYPRALGPAGGTEPDRVDVTTGSPTPPPAGSAG